MLTTLWLFCGLRLVCSLYKECGLVAVVWTLGDLDVRQVTNDWSLGSPETVVVIVIHVEGTEKIDQKSKIRLSWRKRSLLYISYFLFQGPFSFLLMSLNSMVVVSTGCQEESTAKVEYYLNTKFFQDIQHLGNLTPPGNTKLFRVLHFEDF